MARMKSRPLQRTTKRKSQDRGARAREGLRVKRLRLQSPEERPSTSSKKAKKKKGMPCGLLFVLYKVLDRDFFGRCKCSAEVFVARTVESHIE